MNTLIEWLPGVAMMANVHPWFVHFPIALLSAFVVVEAGAWLARREGWRIAASALLYLGTLGAAGAVTAGWLAAQTVPHGEAVHDILERHEHIGFSVLALAILLSLWRLWRGSRFRGLERACHVLLALLMVGIMAVGADLGGLMVYGHGVGVRTIDAEGGSGHHHAPDSGEHEHMHD